MYKKLLILFVIFLTGCLTPIQITSMHDFENAHKMLDGNNTIKGSALIRQLGGGVVTCAGNEVSLMPVEPMFNELISKIYGNSIKGYKRIHPKVTFASNQNLGQVAIKKTLCNAQGFFSFENIGDGEFFVETSIRWGTEIIPEGGVMFVRVSVKDGQEIDIVLTP